MMTGEFEADAIARGEPEHGRRLARRIDEMAERLDEAEHDVNRLWAALNAPRGCRRALTMTLRR